LTSHTGVVKAHALGARLQLSTAVTHVRKWNSEGAFEMQLSAERRAARAKGVIMALSASQAHVVGHPPTRDATEALARRSRHEDGGGLRAPV
jgi:hypothetical protein